MVTTKYFDLQSEPPSYIKEGKQVDSSEPVLPLKERTYWVKLIGKKATAQLVSGKEVISVIIPFHDSPCIEAVLRAIKEKQALPRGFKVSLTIVASGCTKDYLNLADGLSKRLSTKNFLVKVINQPLPGKPLALNTGIKHIDNEIIIQLTDDIIPSKYVLALLFLSLKLNPDFGASVSVGLPSNISQGTILSQTQRLHHELFYKNDQYALVGRAFAFRKSIVAAGFPTEIMSEDFWLEMVVNKKTKGFLIANNCFVYYKKPETWLDYLKQLDRFDSSFGQLQRCYADMFRQTFGEVKNSFRSLVFGTGRVGYIDGFSRYFQKQDYSLITKFVYIFIVLYQLYYLRIKNSLFPLKTAVFSREESTL